MPSTSTAYFGELEYTDQSVFEFPDGILGFEQERFFVFIRRPQAEPLIFMQSLANETLCFLMLPVLAACPDYRLNLTAEDLCRLQLPPGVEPRIGEDILCGALVCTSRTEGPTANLLGPIVLNLKARIGAQVIQSEAGYSHQHPLVSGEAAAICS